MRLLYDMRVDAVSEMYSCTASVVPCAAVIFVIVLKSIKYQHPSYCLHLGRVRAREIFTCVVGVASNDQIFNTFALCVHDGRWGTAYVDSVSV